MLFAASKNAHYNTSEMVCVTSVSWWISLVLKAAATCNAVAAGNVRFPIIKALLARERSGLVHGEDRARCASNATAKNTKYMTASAGLEPY